MIFLCRVKWWRALQLLLCMRLIPSAQSFKTARSYRLHYHTCSLDNSHIATLTAVRKKNPLLRQYDDSTTQHYSKKNNNWETHIIHRFTAMKNQFSLKPLWQKFGLSKSRARPVSRWLVSVAAVLFTFFSSMTASPRSAVASGAAMLSTDTAIKSPLTPLQGLFLWAALFVLSAVMHSAESALTKLSVWQVKELAAEQGEKSPFASLSKNLTRYLITILLTTTACSIYSTALFVASVSALCPRVSLGLVTAALTLITLFFGELLPKAIAVRNSEAVASRLLPVISRVALLLTPLTTGFTALSDTVLSLCGVSVQSQDSDHVSEDMLRRVVDEAQRSSEGIETGEGRMIKGVLDMQDKEVGRIMRPRVDVLAIPETLAAPEILQTAVLSRYSRIPVFSRDIDHIVGIVFTKDLLDYLGTSSATTTSPYSNNSSGGIITHGSGQTPSQEEVWRGLTARSLMEPAYFVPESMSCWDALQEMKKRRTHMAIVLDEYGGTSGLVTFEDILEEVVGEIYDEDDGQEEQTDDWTILRRSDNGFQMKGTAELDDVCEALNISPDLTTLPECSTLGGLLCALAGRIPRAGDYFDFAGYRFTVRSVQDGRRLEDVLVLKQPASSSSSSSANTNNNSNSNSNNNNSNGDAVPDVDGFRMEDNSSNNNYYYNSNSNSYNNHSGSGRDGEGHYSDSEVEQLTSSIDTRSHTSNNNNNNNNNIDVSVGLSSASSQAHSEHEPPNTSSTNVAVEFEDLVKTHNTHSSNNNNDTVTSDSNDPAVTVVTSSAATPPVSTSPSSSSSAPVTSRLRYDSRSNKFLVFRDGEWLDPDIL